MLSKKANCALLLSLLTMPALPVWAQDLPAVSQAQVSNQNTSKAWVSSEVIPAGSAMSQKPLLFGGTDPFPMDTDPAMVRVVKRGTPPPQPVNPNTLPVEVQANQMTYSDTTGAVTATGDVDVYQGNRELFTGAIAGNTKTQEYHTVGPFHYLEDKGKLKNLTGDDLSYNTGTNAINAPQVSGWVAPYYMGAQDGQFDGQVGHIKKGWITTKHAMAFKGTPDYSVKGDDITIIPGDKAVIRHAKFYIHGFKLLSLPNYTVSLRHDTGNKVSIFNILPRPMYNSTDGIGLRGNIDYPIGEHGEAYFEYRLYVKSGFKPSIGYRQYLPWGTAQLGYDRSSATLDAKTVWVEKRPEFSIETNTYQVGSTPFTVHGGASLGYWKEGYIKGSHRMYYGEISHTPIAAFGNHVSLRTFAGYQNDHYGYEDRTRSMPYYGADMNWRVNNRISVWSGYRQANIAQGYDSPYPFDTVEIKYKGVLGGSIQLTRLDQFIVNIQKDMRTGQTKYVDYTWHRDLHSFEAWLTYRAKQQTWEYLWRAKDF